MATNCYHYKEEWSFDLKNPSVFFGWGIMTSGGQLQIATFRAPGMRDEMADEVEAVLAKAGLTPNQLSDIDSELLAACFLLMAGGSDEDRTSAQYIAEEELEAMPAEGTDFWEQLTEIGSKYSMM